MIDAAQLSALHSVERHGSFEKAARELHVTPSAISQRIRILEERLGIVLIVRGQPCTATNAGERLCRHAEEIGLLEHRVLKQLGVPDVQSDQPILRIAINADSLSTWFVGVIALLDDLLLDVVLDNEDHSANWLRRGEVSAALTVATTPVQGCGRCPLGSLRYLATASPDFVARSFPNGVDANKLASARCLEFNAQDQLQIRWLRQYIDATSSIAPGHRLPSSNAFVDATLAGIGWGMNPELLVRQHLDKGRLIELVPNTPLDIPLVWQWSRAIEPALEPITSAVVSAASQQLIPNP